MMYAMTQNLLLSYIRKRQGCFLRHTEYMSLYASVRLEQLVRNRRLGDFCGHYCQSVMTACLV